MTYILLIVYSAISLGPVNFTLTEFQTKQACEVALKRAKTFYRTVNDHSECISVEHEIKKQKAKEELDRLKND